MIFKVRVKPGAKEERVEKISENDYRIAVKERPEKGKANERVLKILSKELRIDVWKIKIKNPSGRKKIIKVQN